MNIISVNDLSKEFKVPVREKGLWESVKSVFKREYEIKHAVKRISFDIPKGQIVGFLGPNGAGKSTTIKMLTGILEPTSGQMSVRGLHPFNQRSQYVQYIGALFGQKTQLWWDLPASDSFELVQHVYGIDAVKFERNKKELIKRLDVKDLLKRPVRNLSLGERMKCEFVMALLHFPEIVFLDEPTIGLDVFAKESIRDFIVEWNKKYGTTFILTTHDMDDIDHLAEHVIVINEGEKVFDDSMSALRKLAGNTRRLRVALDGPVPSVNRKGITNVVKVSQHEVQFDLDRSLLSIDKCVAFLTKKGKILDLSVNEPDVEQIIKKIYAKKKRSRKK